MCLHDKNIKSEVWQKKLPWGGRSAVGVSLSFFTTRVYSTTGGCVFTGVCLFGERGVAGTTPAPGYFSGLWSQVLSWLGGGDSRSSPGEWYFSMGPGQNGVPPQARTGRGTPPQPFTGQGAPPPARTGWGTPRPGLGYPPGLWTGEASTCYETLRHRSIHSISLDGSRSDQFQLTSLTWLNWILYLSN